MMIFTFTVENIHFKIEAQTIEDGLFHLFITSSKNGESYTHYLSHVPLPTDQQACLEELEIRLEEDQLLENLLLFWERLEQSGTRPRWAV